MEERKIERFAVAVSLIGVLIILFVSESMEAKTFSIADINESLEENIVKISGEVVSVQETDSLLMLDVKDESGTIKVVAFTKDFVDVYEGDKIEIEGDVALFKDELEIEAKMIKIV